MNMQEFEGVLESYQAWLRDKTVIKQLKDCIEVTTPYLDRHNDYIQIYVQKNEGSFIITDGGETLADLEQSGCPINSPKRRSLLQSIVKGFGVREENGELLATADRATFALRKHGLIQAILSANDMFFMAPPTIESLFVEDVAAWLEKSEIRYSPRLKLPGKSGLDHMFDFVIPKSKQAPERIVQAINNPTQDNVKKMLMAWSDTKDSRSAHTEAVALLNDTQKTPQPRLIEALRSYEITPALWSHRADFCEKLAA